MNPLHYDRDTEKLYQLIFHIIDNLQNDDLLYDLLYDSIEISPLEEIEVPPLEEIEEEAMYLIKQNDYKNALKYLKRQIIMYNIKF